MIPCFLSNQERLPRSHAFLTKGVLKSLSKMRVHPTDQVVVGIDRQGRFLRNFFTRLSDLPQAAGAVQPHPDLGTLSIARILTIEKPGPEQPATSEV